MGKQWTSEEVDRLCKIYPYMLMTQCTDLFPGRTLMAIYKKAASLGLNANPDKKSLNEFIANNHQTMGATAMASSRVCRIYNQISCQEVTKDGISHLNTIFRYVA